MPVPIAARTAWAARRSFDADFPGSSPGPRWESAATPARNASDSAAGSAVSHSDWCGPSSPTAISVPMTATATKLTELLISRNATERRAILSSSIPSRCRIQAPNASPLAPLVGISEPTASSASAISVVVRRDSRGQKTGRNIST